MSFVDTGQTTPRKRLSRWRVWALLVGLCCATACLQPRAFTEHYLQLTIEALAPQTGHLQIKLATCEAGAKVGEPLEQERAVSLRFGSELFYIPPHMKGTVDIKIFGYRTAAKQSIVQYARTIVTLQAGTRAFPAMLLREGRPDQEPFWCEPVVLSPVPTPPPFRYPSEVPLGGSVPSSSGLPPLGKGPSQIPVPPRLPPTSPSDFGEQETAVLRSPLPWKRATLGAAASGRLVVLINQADDKQEASLSVVDVVSGFQSQEIPLAPSCKPSGLDVQGTLAAVLCYGLGRIYYFSIDTGTPYGPSEGIIVGKDPIAVRMSGNVVVVANRGSQYVLVMRIGRWSDLPKTHPVGEAPSAITAVNGRFYVASAESSSVSTFIVDQQFHITESANPYQVGNTPVGVAANDWYLVTANAGSANITIWDLIRGNFRTLYLGGRPHAVVLLNHTAIVSDTSTQRLFVVDLRAGRVTQALAMGIDVEHIALTGEWLLMSSPKGGALARATLSKRGNLVLFRLGASPEYVHVADGKAWVHDRLAGQLNVVDLRRHTVEAQIPLQSDGWLNGTQDLLLHTTANRTSLVIRSLKALGGAPLKIVNYDKPIHKGRVVTRYSSSGKDIISQAAYFLNLSNQTTGATLSSIHNLHLSTDQWHYVGPVAVVLDDVNITPELVDILPVDDERVLLLEQRDPTLYLFNTRTRTVELPLSLPSRPLQMIFIKEKVALLLDDGELWIVEVPKLKRTQTIRLANKSGYVNQIREFNGLIAYIDSYTGQVAFLEPDTASVLARFRVGCKPTDLNFWRNPADVTTWRHLLVVTNACGESLSLYPFDLGAYTK